MGLYSESIKAREEFDRRIEDNADKLLQQKHPAKAIFSDDEIAESLKYILVKYGLTFPAFSPVKNVKGKVTKKLPLNKTAYEIYRPFANEKRKLTVMNMAGFILSLVSARDVMMILSAAFMISVLGLVNPRISRFVLRDVVTMGSDGMTLLFRSLILFLSVGIIRSGFTVMKSSFLGRLRIRLSSQAQAAMMTKVLRMPADFFADASTGKLSKQISNTRYFCDQVVNLFINSSLTAIFSLMCIPQMGAFSSVLLIPAVTVLFVKGILTFTVGYLFAEWENEKMRSNMDMRGFLFTVLKGIQRINESGAERRVY